VDAETTIPTCYRHDDRETRLSCSRCGRPVCVDCVRSASVGQLCPECARPEPGARVITARQLRAAGLRQTAPVTFWLIATCGVAFLLSAASPVVGAYGAQVNALVEQGEWWRIVTAAFLHGGLLHIFFNMYALYLFGPGLERQVGGPAFLSLYLGSAVAGGAAYFASYALGLGAAGAAVGASGAIFGLFGATLALAWRNRRSAVGQAGLRQLLTLLGINLALPLLVPAIAWQAHLGGLVAGVLVALWWAGAARRGGSALRSLAGAAIALLALAVVIVL
jgi:membrane associated rhomboid family serine protease